MTYIKDISNIWEMVKDSLTDKMPQSAVNLWFGDLKVVSFEGNRITFSIESEFKHNIILDKKYDEMIAERFSSIIGFNVSVEVKFVGTPADKQSILDILTGEKKVEEKVDEEKPKVGGTLPPYNFEYTFDNFIVGNSNKFAHAACVAVANNVSGINPPSKNMNYNYNPLFIYGPSGLGKTHLLYAITNKVKSAKPDAEIIYIKGDDFTNQMIESLKRQAMPEFREKYRSCDVLLIDDIQFIAGKEATQEEFFHTFNYLHEDHKQIILTSDRPPYEIKTLEERLKSRFEWGLIADIAPPDHELRIAIIKKKAEQVNIEIPDDVLKFLAENLRSNIRQIEGAIKKLAALSFLSGKPVTMETAKGCISELLGGAEPTSVTVDKIFSAIFKKYEITREDIVGKKRTKEIAAARHIAVYLIRKITDMSLPNIGKIIGGRDHTTVLSSNDLVEKKMRTDELYKYEIENLIKEITGQA